MDTSSLSATLPAASPDTTDRPVEELTRFVEAHTLDAAQVLFKRGQRAFFVGMTGSGKTFLATDFLERAWSRVPQVVIDPKGTFEGHGAVTWEYLSDLPRDWERQIRRIRRPKHLRVVIRPELLDDMRRNATLNSIYQRVFAEGNCLIYLDEVEQLCYGNRAHISLTNLVKLGRQKLITVWAGTQRPAGVPRMFFSESDHLFTFYLVDEEDRKRIRQFMGPAGLEIPGPGKHDFWYRPPGTHFIPALVHQGDE